MVDDKGKTRFRETMRLIWVFALLFSDLAIAFGFNRITRTLPKTLTTGTQLPINKLSDALRNELARAGYDETLTMALCSFDDNFKSMLIPDPGDLAVTLANPKTEEFQIARTNRKCLGVRCQRVFCIKCRETCLLWLPFTVLPSCLGSHSWLAQGAKR
jgi:hypothetical protein